MNVLGFLDNGTGEHQSNQVLDTNGLMRCQYAGQDKNSTMILENIHKYGNASANYMPFDGAISYPLHSQDFVRTGFLENAPTLSARDYKDPKVILEKND